MQTVQESKGSQDWQSRGYRYLTVFQISKQYGEKDGKEGKAIQKINFKDE
ncbi:hypothetical protein JCM19231_2780 [Vibrio ishigakensis]|uniref:Uncharacterized protein n=1 Tax=Vibrio ishigakensis TaxID=1481914 RepID=A0A0B8P4D5_9VIBR|nr:hypothetical protein JCM19231_2780 [Vibrio ishigakensis]